MGLILGKITVETPKYEVLHTTADYEIREYAPSVVAEVTYDPSDLRGDRDGGFMILASYIGAVGDPKNSASEKVPMTAPVVVTSRSPEKIAMTAPVVTSSAAGSAVTMGFMLPSKYSRAEEAEVLRRSLERDGYKVAGDFVLARYNPPWTLPPLRTNEVMIPVE